MLFWTYLILLPLIAIVAGQQPSTRTTITTTTTAGANFTTLPGLNTTNQTNLNNATITTTVAATANGTFVTEEFFTGRPNNGFVNNQQTTTLYSGTVNYYIPNGFTETQPPIYSNNQPYQNNGNGNGNGYQQQNSPQMPSFAHADVDRNGRLSWTEVKRALATLSQPPMPQMAMELLFYPVDMNRDRVLSQDEYGRMTSNVQALATQTPEQDMDNFMRADYDGDGRINLIELLKFTASSGLPSLPPLRLLEKVILQADKDGDKMISRDEYTASLNGPNFRLR